ncbi:Rho guanine nucleotide exchange factor 12 [Papilio machaon]|uniref:Rho guanine nucleotide exchange factor 12 n=1 Tax=Papilio machaon TaxID=76193 RepID=A0A0N1IPD5_PAPMA|nr:Rho guanine nucleotide exchange factor 12 [Papilio machaon]
MKVSGDNPVYVQSVKEHGAAWRAGLRAGDRILCVDSVHVYQHTHQQVVHMIRAKPTTVLTVQQNSSRTKTPITAPLPVNPENQRQLEESKVLTMRLMLQKEQKYIRELRNEVQKVPDVRKQAQLEAAIQRCSKLQHEIDIVMAAQSAQSAPGARLPLPPRSTERPQRGPPSPPHPPHPPTQRPPFKEQHPLHSAHEHRLRRSSHSLDGELDGPQPNSIALQLSYPLVNVPPPPLQTDSRGAPVLHARSQSSPEQLEHDLSRTSTEGGACPERAWEPPGTPPPPYAHNTQPCVDPQRAIISMEEDDPPTSVNSSSSGLFSNLRSVRDSRARMAVLLNWLIGERRCPCAWLVLVLTEQFRTAAVPTATLRRWAYEIQSSFLMPHAVTTPTAHTPYRPYTAHTLPTHCPHTAHTPPTHRPHTAHTLPTHCPHTAHTPPTHRPHHAHTTPTCHIHTVVQYMCMLQVLQLNGVDEHMANEIDHVLLYEHHKEEVLRNEQVVVERLLYEVIRAVCSEGAGVAGGAGGVGGAGCGGGPPAPPAMCSTSPAHRALLAALAAAACSMDCRPAAVAAAGQAAGARESFLLRDKLYKQRLKHIAKQRPQPYVVRGHQLQLQALTSVAHCHHCDLVIWGLAPQAYVCANCKLRVHRECGKAVEEGCVLDGETQNNRISRFMERIHHNNMPGQDAGDKKSRKASGTSHFLNMERSFRKMEDETTWEQTLTPTPVIGECF